MIKEHACYSVQCNRCGKDCQHEAGEVAGWTDASFSLDEANDANWLTTWGVDQHFCPDCWKWDDDEDQIPKPGIVIHLKH